MVTGYNFHTKCVSFVEGVFVMIVNSVDSDKMPQYAAFHLGLHCLPKNEFRREYKVLSDAFSYSYLIVL